MEKIMILLWALAMIVLMGYGVASTAKKHNV